MLTEDKNLDTLNKRISELELKGNMVVVFDFDELLVPIHLTRTVSKKVSKPVDEEKLTKLGSCSFKGMLYLQELVFGFDFNKYKEIRDKIVKETEWQQGFDKLIKDLVEKHDVIVLSSGLKDVAYAKLKEINFNEKNIIGNEFNVEDGLIANSKLIVSDILKGYVIDELKKNRKTVAIGHGLGDKAMLDSADVSISYNSDIPNLAQYNVSSIDEIIKLIK